MSICYSAIALPYSGLPLFLLLLLLLFYCLDYCASNPCMNGGTCFNDDKSFKCICTGQYTGITCQECKYID